MTFRRAVAIAKASRVTIWTRILFAHFVCLFFFELNILLFEDYSEKFGRKNNNKMF